LTDLLAEHLPTVRCRPGDATYLAWLDCRAADGAAGPPVGGRGGPACFIRPRAAAVPPAVRCRGFSRCP
ncbi:hypothetical protein ACWDUG_14550, partial [Streptomyces cellulosae]